MHLPTVREVIDLVEGLYAAFGYPIVLVAAMLENTLLVGVFFPGGTMVFLGGVYARLGHLSLPLVILVGTIGTFLGASLDYWLARCGLGWLPRRLSMDAHLERSSGWLQRYGFWAVLAAHFLSHLRSLMAVAAGLLPVPYRRFGLWELPAALLWNVLYASVGYFLADHLHLLDYLDERLSWAILAFGGTVIIWRLWRRRSARTPTVGSV